MNVGSRKSLTIPVGEGLILREAIVADAPALFDAIWEAPDHLGKFDPGTLASFPTLEATKNQILSQDERKRIFCMWFEDQFAGAVNLRVADQSPENITYHIGYWIREKFAMHGHTSRAARVVTDYAFSEIGAGQVNARIHAGNVASAATAQNAGFRYMATEESGMWLFSAFREIPEELKDVFSDEVHEINMLKSGQHRSVAWVRLDGVAKPVINHGSDTTYIVETGEVTFIVDGEAELLKTGDQIRISCGTTYQDIGRASMLAVCEPGFDERQIEIVKPSTSALQ